MKKQSTPKSEDVMAGIKNALTQNDMSVPEAAKVLGVTEQTVYRLMDKGALSFWKKTADRGARIYTSSVKDYIRNVQQRDITKILQTH